MTRWRTRAAALLAALVLAACGGGDPSVPGSRPTSGAPTTPGTFTAVVSFGDSLSDAGTYTPVTSIAGDGQAPYLGGKWTTNTTPNSATIWVENLATRLGVIVTPAQVGWRVPGGPAPVDCPAALSNPALASTCTAYGQGGARVTDPTGIGNDLGALTVPLVAQIDRHLARFGRFGDGDLVFVWGGNNDLFLSFGAFADAAVQIIGRQRLGLISAAEADALLLEAQLAAQARMKTAAGELAVAVRERILARGGRYVAVVTLPDFADIPFGAALAADPTTAALVPVLSGLSAVFNTWLREGLSGQPVQVIDAWALFKRIKASPGNFGLLEVSTPACDFAKQDAVLGRVLTSGRALFCNVTTGAPFDMLRDGADPSTWLFADDAHPTTGGHRVIADEFARQLASWGWIR